MLTVEIISGTYGYKGKGRIIPKDRMSEPFELEDAEAKRLVSLGVAKIITEGVATGGNNEKNTSTSVNPPDDENGSNGENEGGNDIDSHWEAEHLKEMTVKELKALAADLGINTAKFKVKDDYVRSIVAVEVYAPADEENGENPPDIFTEAPVI